MADSLVIVESPTKAKTIGRYLGKNFIVEASMGHIRDLPKSQLGVDVDQQYEPKYITIRGKGDVLKKLRDSKKKVKYVYLAADPDREGEAIAWHLAHYLGIEEDAVCRVVFNEITKDAVKEAFKHPRKIDMDLVHAQQARRILDRLVGYKISPLLWKKVKKGLSAGRVQSVTLKLIVDREKEIQAFIPEEYWKIAATFQKGKQQFEAQYYGQQGKKEELHSVEEVQRILQHLQDKEFVVQKVVKRERKRNPAPPFTTSSLQQEAARKLNFKAAKTMMVAQQLYEGIDLGKEGTVGLITYMRTDSTRVSEVAQKEAHSLIEEQFGDAYLQNTPRKAKNQENAQDAHEAIRPSSVLRKPDDLKAYLSRDQLRLYRLIWERFVASQMASAVLDTMTVDLGVDQLLFRATGSKVKFDGFMRVYVEDTDDAQEEKNRLLPPLEEGERLQAKAIKPSQHFTVPPPRYSEARLVKTLEELGIGRPSTYAPTLELIQKRYYVRLEQKRFVPTELGEIVLEQIEEFFPEIIDIDFTAKMEKDLDLVEEGKEEWVRIVDEFYCNFEKRLKVAEEHMQEVEIKDEVSDELCEKCGRPMVYKMGRFGKFLACSGFPDCRNTKAILKEIGVACPKCKDGQIVERKSKKNRVFYGCNQYPGCDFVSWDKPLARTCPKCGEMLVERKNKKNSTVHCSACDYAEVKEES